ncbi:MAG: 1-deoxy-D-xylulose-5-phosphate synthase [Coriobacteriales bacterium]|nr:1-deoxy-D-xylulose-5-phosphate synthase [Coriobacteriales bacterium]
MERILDTISCPADLKALGPSQCRVLAAEIRSEMISTVSRTGGHLAPSLGAIELIIAIHRFIDAPMDKLIFDVGHQAYAHKMLTGRLESFDTLRTLGGISGFPKREESPYDTHDSGHASDSLSIALGLALARDLNGDDNRVVALIGDGSLSAGMAFEAMNQIGQIKPKMTIVLNDNAMSISKNVGALAQRLAKARMNSHYLTASEKVISGLGSSEHPGTRKVLDAGLRFRDSIKSGFLKGGMLFEELGIKYLGPIDGHDMEVVEETLRAADRFNGPVIIHAVTTKGNGYEPSLEHPDIFHGIGPFDPETGAPIKKSGGAPSFTKVFSQALIAEAQDNPDIVAITAAMPSGTGLDAFASAYPKSFFDVGICEEHAVTFAAGLALGGKLPVVAIYSTFLQRAFDQIVINVALQKQHVVFCVDRAGLVGADGPTHHGAFDLAWLRCVPGLRILSPSNEAELVDALHTALYMDGPVVVRYPRGNGIGVPIPSEPGTWPLGESVIRRAGGDVVILAIGRMVNEALVAAEMLHAQWGIEARVVDMRWVKPIDQAAVAAAAKLPLLVTLEEGTLRGGFGSAVMESLAAQDLQPHVLTLGLPDAFITQGDVDSLMEGVGLSPAGIANSIAAALGKAE